MNRLSYRRQFILARSVIPELKDWQEMPLDRFYLYAHPDLQLTVVRDSVRTLVLLGYIFDPNVYQASNRDVVQNVFEQKHTFEEILMGLKPCTGRYVIIYKDAKSINLVQDALSLREVYYCREENKVVCASQPNLLVRFAEPLILRSSDAEVLDFFNNHLPLVRHGRLWPGDGTLFDGLNHLLPNNFLDIIRLQSHRYWPNTPINRVELNEAVAKSASFLEGALKAAHYRQPLMMAVTAGFDSRALLAASKPIRKSIYYFINKHSNLTEDHADLRIPKEIFGRIEEPFHVHTYPQEVPEEFKEIFLSNTFFSHPRLLPVIYHIYYKEHSEKLNILGVGEVGRTKFFEPPNKLNAYYLSYMLKHHKSVYAIKQCAAWLEKAKPIADRYKLNIMTLFWWEVLIGNWGAVGNSESDISIEEFDPYDSHYLYELFLSIDAKYRTLRDNIFFRELVRYMWPELIEFPVNPSQNHKDRLIWISNKIGIERPLRNLKYLWYMKRYYRN